MIKQYCFRGKRSAYNLLSFITILIVIVVIITGVPGFAAELSQSTQDFADVELEWLTYDQALKKSEIESIPTLIYFYSNNCGWCRKLEDETFSNEQVKNVMNEDFAIVKINSSSSKMIMNEGEEISERQLSQKIYQVNANPTIWFLNSNGERIAPLPGYAPAKDFIIVLRYIKGDYYKEYTFPEYLENMN